MVRILAVDDEPFMLQVFERGLRSSDFQVDVARDGREAIAKVEHGSYQVVITDMEMPFMDGRALCEAMQALPQGPPSLTLVVTGKTDPELRDWAQAMPCTELMEKPVSLRRVVERLRKHMDTLPAAVLP